MGEKKCETCKYHDDFSWVCFNGSSPDRADFTNNDSCCDEWEKKDEQKWFQ